MSYTKDEVIVTRNVEDEMKDSYLRYSMSVIIARALPDARDGLKPSQRRILYAMRQLNLGPNGKHRKCAKISGDTSGDYHPHGEMVIYPTLVRMAQKWVMRYNLVDGQGNFGSVDGDPPAAMRYTEARLTTAAVQLMDDLDKDTVEMVPNYDETKKEPTVFPSKFPNLLCNGSSGIAVGMATNIPPHNLNELIKATLMVLENPTTSVDEIMKVMPGPDFPTGGIICGYRGIKEAFHTGRGKLILRGVIRVEENEETPDRPRLAIDEIPYNVNKSRLIEQIAELINNKTITGISDLRDESDKDGMRIVVELKRGEVPEVIINQLYKFSDLQITFGCNMLALDKGLPRTMNVKQLIAVWIEHRIDVVRRRTRFELNKAEARAHILEGYLRAIDHMDEVVRLIRASQNRDEARAQLIERFQFTERQANAILDLRLYQLTGLERDKINEEYQELLKKIDYYRAVLASEAMVKEIIRDELLDIQKHHKSERQTQIIAAESEVNMEDLIANDPVIITISQDDYIKRMPVSTFREQRRGGQGVTGMQLKREEDTIKGLYVATTHDYLLIFTNLGRCYWLKVWQIPETGRKSKGKPLINLLEDLRPEEKIATIQRVSSFEEEACILMATKRAVVKKSLLSEFSNPRRKGVWALDIDEGDELVAARLVKPEQQVMLFTHQGMAVRFDESNVRPMGRTARGVKGATLREEDDYIVGCEVVNGDESILVVCENGFGKRSQVEDFRQTNRGGVGVRSIITSERNGNVVGALCVTDDDGMVMMSSTGQTVRISMRDLRVMGRNTQGVKLANLRDADYLVAIQKLEGSENQDMTVSEGSPESAVESSSADELEENWVDEADVEVDQVEEPNEEPLE
ncbi:DNA gyrase subunit A [Candidatus Protochlamydia naegleriophila]|uniref:DNA gyrase subunit A n=1 Tax=Candidatus Protochlamydia naegleriophila TaxID=389348 RepID=S4TLB6_9BACT|nr:DNA topoisomerase (ATP-hydrolyzing) subunit A [Candidatus Protochlamydia naegleriophila]AGD98879.1 DNA gyrase subunit A [Candidatus Protochlamydia naegleriophila]CUI16433.1 DNA gyrase subunit A [Candidatus Protochlamydia naegleriophila]